MLDFDIETIGERMVRINDTFIPCVNPQIEGFPCVIDGDEYEKYFEVLFEQGRFVWEVSSYTVDGEFAGVEIEVVGMGGVVLQRFFVPSWGEFLELYFDRRRDPMGARVITTILEERDYNE